MKKFLSVLLTLCAFTWTLAPPAGAQESTDTAKAATPEAQALKVYQAVRDQNYLAMFYLMAFTPKGKSTLTTAEQFALDVQKGYEGGFKNKEEQAVTDAIFRSIAGIMVGEPVITGDKAVLPVSAKITANGQTRQFKGQAFMCQEEGVWKFDLTFTDDAEQAMAQRVQELFGKPEPAP